MKTLNEFLNYHTNCIICKAPNLTMMSMASKEVLGDDIVTCSGYYVMPVIRKKFITFAVSSLKRGSRNDFLDLDTYHSDKYRSFTIDNENRVSFDYNFNYKMKMFFSMACHNKCYSYKSRQIIVSNTSSDITRGFGIETESIYYKNYMVTSNTKEQKTYIFVGDAPEPIEIPYMPISKLPLNNAKKFRIKMRNISLLA